MLGLPFFAFSRHALSLGMEGAAGDAAGEATGDAAGGAAGDAAGGATAAAPALAVGVVVAGVVVPRLYLLLAGNVVSDYCCKVAMTRLIGEASALAATMVITLQRFASLIVSATVLSPAYPPASLWAGIGLVALGSAMYLGAPAARAVGGGRKKSS